MKSKDYQVLVSRLEDEIVKNRQYMNDCNDKRKFGQSDKAKECIKYHEEMISFIKKLDKEG